MQWVWVYHSLPTFLLAFPICITVFSCVLHMHSFWDPAAVIGQKVGKVTPEPMLVQISWCTEQLAHVGTFKILSKCLPTRQGFLNSENKFPRTLLLALRLQSPPPSTTCLGFPSMAWPLHTTSFYFTIRTNNSKVIQIITNRYNQIHVFDIWDLAEMKPFLIVKSRRKHSRQMFSQPVALL